MADPPDRLVEENNHDQVWILDASDKLSVRSHLFDYQENLAGIETHDEKPDQLTDMKCMTDR